MYNTDVIMKKTWKWVWRAHCRISERTFAKFHRKILPKYKNGAPRCQTQSCEIYKDIVFCWCYREKSGGIKRSCFVGIAARHWQEQVFFSHFELKYQLSWHFKSTFDLYWICSGRLYASFALRH